MSLKRSSQRKHLKPKAVLRLPDLDQAKCAVLNSLSSVDAQRGASGTPEVYVSPFPGPGGNWQISNGGGVFPTWSRNGKELFFRTNDDHIMVSIYRVVGDSFQADKPQLWSPGQVANRGPWRNFDLTPDGKRFAVTYRQPSQEPAEMKNDKFVVLLDVFTELRRVASPANK